MSSWTTDQSWHIMDSYFKSHMYPLTKHHIDSFREFLRNDIPSIIRTFNPITMIKLDAKGDPSLTVKIYVGGSSGDAIFIDRPTMIDAEKTEVLLTPAEARLRNLTYEGHIFADVKVVYELPDRVEETVFPKVLLGAVPIMVHSDACILNGQGSDVLRELGECIYDMGGYFILDGKEKVIVSQERVSNNRLFIEETPLDVNFQYRAYIKCVGQTGESKLMARPFELYIARDKNKPPPMMDLKVEEEDGKQNPAVAAAAAKFKKSDYVDHAIYISFEKVRGKIPLFTLFRAFGVETDKDIVSTIFGSTDFPDAYMKYIRASIVAPQTHGESCYTQEEAYEYLKFRTQYQLTEYVKNTLVTDVFPNVTNNSEKPMYLGFLVRQLLDTCLGIYPPTDRDAYTTKRIDISGFQLAGLFQQIYKILSKNCRDLLDREYNLGPWRNNDNARIKDLVRKDNIYKLFPPTIMTEWLVRSLKGMWGSEDKDPEQGRVQDLARISYLGYLSHMRRINLPLDRSRRNVPPHRLHPQQWGFFCPFETPDGQSIGLLKNFSLLSYVTFGTKEETITEYLPRLGIIPLYKATSVKVASKEITKVLVNGTWFGITNDPVYHARLLKAMRRNGYINPFVSISWNIRENNLHIQTEPGRMCRPLLVVRQNMIHVPPQVDNNWFKYLFGTGAKYLGDHEKKKKENEPSVEQIFYTEQMYYKDQFIFPTWWKEDPKTAEERANLIARLEDTQGCVEFIDVDEENTLLIAITAADLDTNKPYTHCEIHPSAMFSVVTNTMPFTNHNYAARNMFHGAQAKQTIGIYASNFRKRFDTMAYVMHYPQKPIVTTKNAHYIASNRMPNGFNTIVAIASYSGFNQEDAIIINKNAVDRGLFQSTAYKTMTATEKIINLNERLHFKNPYISLETLISPEIPKDLIQYIQDAGYKTIQEFTQAEPEKLEEIGLTEKQLSSVRKAAEDLRSRIRDEHAVIQGIKSAPSYAMLNEHGIIREGSEVLRGQKVVVMGMVHVTEEHREVPRGILTEIERVRHYRDVSYTTDVHHYGIVDKVFVGTKALGSSERICKVRFRKNRRPELGDKACSRHAQKGVIGMMLPEQDMPMTKDGIVPDLIINPHALPSRMTIAHLVECIFAKGCCLEGASGDGTMFIPVDYDVIGKPLEQQGFHKHGNEVMYDGRTGRQIDTEIFIGPTFYYRLKHMVSDKLNARHGNPPGLARQDLPYDNLTRQPTEGRARNGGLRIGEMERDVILSHGMSQFTKESMMERSDRYQCGVCRYCGILADPGRTRNTYICPNCKRNDVAMIAIPYACKLLTQEFEAFGVQMRYNLEDVEEEEPIHGTPSEVGSEIIDEEPSEYPHNQDLDEPALYGTEEHDNMYGGDDDPDIPDLFLEPDLVPEPAPNTSPDMPLASPPAPNPVIPAPPVPATPPVSAPVSAPVSPLAMQSSIPSVSATPLATPTGPPSIPATPLVAPLGTAFASPQPFAPVPAPGMVPEGGMSGGSVILDLDGGDAEFFLEDPIRHAEPRSASAAPGEIKVIQIQPKLGGYYRPPPRSGDDYGGDSPAFDDGE